MTYLHFPLFHGDGGNILGNGGKIGGIGGGKSVENWGGGNRWEKNVKNLPTDQHLKSN